MVCSDQVDLGINVGSVLVPGKIMQMWNWVPVWGCGAIKASVISSWPPITRFLRNHVQRGGPRTAGWADDPDLLQAVKLCFGLL